MKERRQNFIFRVNTVDKLMSEIQQKQQIDSEYSGALMHQEIPIKVNETDHFFEVGILNPNDF